MLVVQHNLVAMNTQRQFGINTKTKSKSVEKLSSGYKINKSADDAAGLSISEKMRRQIRGLAQASKNVQDGISLVQVADGAMHEIHDMLQRGNELCIKAANGTLSDEDRGYIQEEINQLEKEIDGLSDRVDFNGILVLKGNQNGEVVVSQGNEAVIKGGFPNWVSITGTSGGYMSGTYETTETYRDTNGVETDYQIPHAATYLDFSSYDGSDEKKKELMSGGFYTTCCTCKNHYSINFSSGSGSSMTTSGEHYIYTIGLDGINNAEDLIKAIVDGTENGNPDDHFTYFIQSSNNVNELVVYDVRSSSGSPVVGKISGWQDWEYCRFNIKPHEGYGYFGTGVAYSATDFESFRYPVDLYIQAGAEAGQHLDIELPEISALALGIDTVDASTIEGASKGINSFKTAIEYVNDERSRMGAYQNRLEHTMRNLDNVVENTQASEVAIRDTDMAEEIVQLAKWNILEQAGFSIMAQANQSNQGVLNLLQ